jgi:hypothetical protein
MRIKTAAAALATVFAVSASSAAAEPPKTSITAGPDGSSVLTEPEFHFVADQPATFECSVDGAAFSACSSPAKIGPLALGPHTFTVRAFGSNGELEGTPPTRSWTVEPPLTNPVIKLKQPKGRTLSIPKLRQLSGTATSPSGIKRVQVALFLGEPDRDFFPPRCGFLHLKTGRPDPRPCLLPRYFATSGTLAWRYEISARVRKNLKPGRYTLMVRAFNAYQQATQSRFKLTLRK